MPSQASAQLKLVHSIGARQSHLASALANYRRQRLTVPKLLSGAYGSRAGLVQEGLYQHLRRSEAIWNFLMLAGVPQTAAQVYEAITVGKAKSMAEDPLQATYHSLYNGTEAGKFVKVVGLGGENLRRSVAMWTIAT